MDDALRQRARNAPREPGVYLWKDEKGHVLYVGKSQDLRGRLGNYLATTNNEKQAAMVNEARDLEVIVVRSVKEALILEQNLIKHHRPPYNVMLVDDKKYPYIAVTSETWPRIVYTRDLRARGSFFGPFPDAGKAKRIARMLNKTFQLRQCRVLPKRECLYYHLKQCSAPCIQAVTSAAYAAQVRRAEEFLSGQGAELSRRVARDMESAAQAQRFEEAAELRDLKGAIDSVLERQHVETASGRSYDALGFASRDDRGLALVLFVRDGLLVGQESYALGSVRGEPLARIVESFVEQYYGQSPKLPPEVLLPVGIERPEPLEAVLSDRRGGTVRLRAPERGEGRRFVELAEKNAALGLDQEFLLRERRGGAALEELRRALDLPDVPEVIEAFDISHHAGEHTVASMVCLKDGKPHKARYRRYKIRTTGGGDDPGAMAEVVRRRYTRLLAEEGADALPNLILIDGGRPQLGAAHAELAKLGLDALPTIGLAKRFEEIHRPNVLHPLRLDAHSSALHLLQLVRDEAHRFAIGYQGILKRKAFVGSALDEVPGVGPERRRRLLATFGSVDAIERSTAEDLARVPGITRPLANRILEHLREARGAT